MTTAAQPEETTSGQASTPAAGTTHRVTVRVRYFAGARAAAGVAAEDVSVPGDDQHTTVRAIRTDISHRHGPELNRVLTACGFLLDGVTVRNQDIPVPDGAELDVLPPFAGG